MPKTGLPRLPNDFNARRKATEVFEGTRLLMRGRKTAQRTDVAEIALLRNRLSPGDAAFDIGANKGGYLACLASSVGSSGLVVAFEPIPELASRLSKAASRLRWGQVEICAAAASDTDGNAMLATPDGDRHWESSLEHNAAPGASTREVRTVRIDRYLDQLDGRRLTAIKIDVEGHESAVIRGGHRILERHKPILLVEVEARHRPDRDPRVFFAEMDNLDYRGWFVRNGKRESLDSFDLARDQSEAENGVLINNFVFEPK